MACFPAEKFRRRWLTRTVGDSGASRTQTGPNCSELNWKRAGASMRSFAGDGSGAFSLYETSIVLPGFNPIGPFVPTVSVIV